MILPDARSLPHGLAQLPEKLGRRSSQPRVVRTGSLRTQSARHRLDHGTICGRTCANSGHYKPLCAFVDRTFVNSKFVAPASRKNSFPPAGPPKRPEGVEWLALTPPPGGHNPEWVAPWCRQGHRSHRHRGHRSYHRPPPHSGHADARIRRPLAEHLLQPGRGLAVAHETHARSRRP
jgi:hypothetical protein